MKGGAALLLRLDPNRTSDDVDLTYVEVPGGHALALEALRADAALDLGDFFAFHVEGTREIDAAHPTARALSVSIVARVGLKEWTRFPVDLALPMAERPTEAIPVAGRLTGLAAVDEVPGVRVLAASAQIADKICALHERHGRDGEPSSRARDLADIALMAAQVDGLFGDDLRAALVEEEQRRIALKTLPGPLPGGLQLTDEQRRDWRQRWRRATRRSPIGFDEALALAGRLVDPVLADAVAGLVWNPSRQRWL